MMEYKKIQLYCESCHWKKIFDNSKIEELYEYSISPIQKNVPKIFSKELSTYNFRKKFRCPKCGRMLSPKVILDVQKNMDEKVKAEVKEKHRQELEKKFFLREKDDKKNNIDGD